MPTLFSSIYQSLTLTYHAITGEKQTDGAGKEFYPTEPRTVEAWLKTPKGPEIRAQIGADPVVVDYEGRLTDPETPPEGFVTGTAVEFEMDGRTVRGRVIVFAPSPLPGMDQRTGRRIQVTANG